MLYQIPRDETVCAHFSVKSGVIFTAVWRSILGFNGFIYGIILLHYDHKAINTFTYALLARDTRIEVELRNVFIWAIGYLVGATIQMLLGITLFYLSLTEKLTVKLLKVWLIISTILSAVYVIALIYVIHIHEMRRLFSFSSREPYPDFMIFALPFMGEGFHWFFLLVVRCRYVDLMDFNYPVYEYRFNPADTDTAADTVGDTPVYAIGDTTEVTGAGTAEDTGADTAENTSQTHPPDFAADYSEDTTADLCTADTD